MQEETKSYLLIHLAVVLFGFTAILGALIDLNAFVLVWWRVLIAAIGLTFFTKGIGFLKSIPLKDLRKFSIIGFIIALHWTAFFASVKLAGASVCLVCMATTCLFISFIEPLILKQRFRLLDFSVALLIVPGMVFVVNSVGVSKIVGILIGLGSAALAALFASLNKKYISHTSVWNLSWIEMMSAWITLGIIILGADILGQPLRIIPHPEDWIYLFLLGIVCTTIGHAMSLFALRHITAFSLNLVVNLEPVYGIILAALLLKENKELNAHFYIGTGLIILAVFTYPFLKKKFSYAF